mgnify:CR=1 FL=1
MGKIEITHEIEEKCCVHRGIKGTPAPIPQDTAEKNLQFFCHIRI